MRVLEYGLFTNFRELLSLATFLRAHLKSEGVAMLASLDKIRILA